MKLIAQSDEQMLLRPLIAFGDSFLLLYVIISHVAMSNVSFFGVKGFGIVADWVLGAIGVPHTTADTARTKNAPTTLLAT